MKNYNSIQDLAMAYALSNINSGVNNDLNSEVKFVKKEVIKFTNGMSAQRMGISGKCFTIIGFGYAMA